MSIITFYNKLEEETGQTLALVALATNMAIDHNLKVLIISTGYKEKKLNRAFWEQKKKTKGLGLFSAIQTETLEDHVDGLVRVIRSNKLVPEIITNYTQAIFTDRLEVLKSFDGTEFEYPEVANKYGDIVSLAKGYYDLVFVDLDEKVDHVTKNAILEDSDLIISTIGQGISSLDKYQRLKEEMPILKNRKNLILIGKYDSTSKFNIKNISRYVGEKEKVGSIPYNTLFFEAAEEGKVVDLFLKMKRYTKTDDKNGLFMQEVNRMTESIKYRLQDLQSKI